jgi:hypothetical protein
VAHCVNSDGDDICAQIIAAGDAAEYTEYTGGYYALRNLVARIGSKL